MTQTDPGVNNDPTISLDELKRMSAARVNRPTGEARAATGLDRQKMNDARTALPDRYGPPSWPGGTSGVEAMMEDRHPVMHRAIEGGVNALGMAAGGEALAGPAAARGFGRLAEGAKAMAANKGANTALGAGAGAVAGGVKEKTGSEGLAIATEMLAPYGLQKLGKGAYDAALGQVSKEAERLLPIAREKFGFTVRPSQAREEGKMPKNMKLDNQVKANRAASEATGMPTDAMDSQWFKFTEKQFGQAFEQVYNKANKFTVDVEGAQKLSDMVSEIEQLAPLGGLTKVRTGLYKALAGAAPEAPIEINGEELKFIRGELNKVRMAHTPASWKAGEAIDVIDEGVRASDPRVGEILDRTRPLYRAWKTLDTLRANGGLNADGNLSPEKLGKFLADKDPKYRRDSSTNALAELGEVGEMFGIRAVWEKENSEPLVGAVKKMFPYAKAGALAGGAGFLGGMDPATAAVMGAGAKFVGKRALEGKTGQRLQQSGGKYMREQPDPVAAIAGGAVTGGEDAPQKESTE